VLGQNY